MSKDKKNKISKDDFISFLSSATPEELNRLIAEKGKPPKLIEPMVFFEKKTDDSDKH